MVLITQKTKELHGTNVDVMAVAYCFVEVFNKDSHQWEFLYNFNVEPFYENAPNVSTYNQITQEWEYHYVYPELPEKVESFFLHNTCELVLLHTFKKIENRNIDSNQWKDIPNNVSPKVKKEYNFLVKEVKACHGASSLYLLQLLQFDYDQFFDIKKLKENEYKYIKENSFHKESNNKEKQFSYRNYLGKAFFQELETIQQIGDPCNIRLIYFVDDFIEFMINDMPEDILLNTILQNTEIQNL